MSRKKAFATVLTLAIVFSGAGVARAHGNATGEARATIGRAQVVVRYRRPELKGRDPLKMISSGEPWRLGADVPTTLETTGPLDFGGIRVNKGNYYLFAIFVQKGDWSLVVSRQPIERYEPSVKVAEIPLVLSEGEPSVDEMTINLAGRGSSGRIEVRWGTFKLTGNFSAAR